MPAKIRLARRGKKRKPFYHIVIADSRAPRDGKFIEQIGFYNPNTDPATIELDFDKTLNWLQKGAQPTDTCRTILSNKGVLYKNHLLQGFKKNALTEEQAEAKFNEWLKDKEAKTQAAIEKQLKNKQDAAKNRLEAETKAKEEKAAEIAKKNAKAAKAESEEAEAETEVEAETTGDVVDTQDAPAEEPSTVEATDAPAEEKTEEPKAEVEEPKAEEEKTEEPITEEPKAEAEEPKAEAEEAKEEEAEPAAEEEKTEE